MLKKLSLAALIAMGSMSVASATPLTEAIKGVDLSGMIRVRYYNESDKTYTDRWRTSADFKFTVPVSEELKVIYKLGVEGSIYANDDTLDNTKDNKVDPSVNENLVYLNYSANGLNVIAGKIPVATSVTGSGHGEAHGGGIIASYKVVDQLTLAAGWVNAVKGVDNVGDLSANDIYALAALFNVEDMVKGSAWYYHVTHLVDYLYTVSVDVTPVDFVTLSADYAAGELEGANTDTKTYFNVSAGANFEGACVQVGYAATNDEVGEVVLDVDAPISAVLPTAQKYHIANKQDTSAIYAKAGYDVADNANVYVAYATIDDDTADNKDYSEVVLGGSYKYTKKMKFSAYYSMVDGSGNAKDDDNNEFRFEAKYSF